MITEKLSRIAGRVVFFLALIPIAALTFFTLWSHTYIDMRGTEEAFFRTGPFYYYLLLAMVVLMLPLVHRLLRKISERTLFFGGLILYLALGTFLICYASDILRADAGMVYSYAQRVSAGDYSGFDATKYLNHYPFQLGLMTLERFLLLFSSSTKILFVSNLVFCLISNLFMWRIATEVLQEEIARKWAILLSFLFLPHLFFILFAYGQVPGLCGMLGGIYYTLRFWGKGQWRDLVYSALFYSFACQMKKNYTIAVIAVVILYLLRTLRERSWKREMLGAIMIAACVIITNAAVIGHYARRYGAELNPGEPMAGFFAMGLQDAHGDETTPSANCGWENGYVFDHFDIYGADADAVTDLSIAYLKERVPYMLSHPGYMAHFFLNKLRSTWTDPLFQSVWSGPQEAYGQPSHHILLISLYRGGHVYNLLEVIMHVVLFLLYLLTCYRVCRVLAGGTSAGSDALLLVMVYFLGGLLYHLLSETKSQYVFMYVYLMILPAVQGLQEVMRGIKERRKPHHE